MNIIKFIKAMWAALAVWNKYEKSRSDNVTSKMSKTLEEPEMAKVKRYSTLEIQTRLKALGYDPGKLDGDWGPATKTAVINFQQHNNLDVDGIIGPRTTSALFSNKAVKYVYVKAEGAIPPWIVLGRKYIGLHEVRDNKKLRDFLDDDGKALGDPAKLPWCGDFIDTCIHVPLTNEPRLDNPYWALNWTKFGVKVPDGIVPLGAIGAKSRNGGGHVFFVIGHDAKYFFCLGGNQSNSISIVKILKSDLEGSLRWPSTYPLPTKGMEYSTINAVISKNEA